MTLREEEKMTIRKEEKKKIMWDLDLDVFCEKKRRERRRRR